MTRLLNAAVEAGVIAASPAAGVRTPKRQQPGVQAVPRSEIPTVDEARLLLLAVATVSPSARRLVGYLATTLYAGLRPGEANGLRLEDVDLPVAGWGTARVTTSFTEPGARWTDDGAVTAEGPVKARAAGDVREVPLHPALVTLLRTHLELWPVEPGGRLFTSSRGGVPNGNIDRVLGKARERVGWTGAHPLAGTSHYTLRHTCASTLLDGGMPAPVVAQRMGHTLEVLLRTYAHVVNRRSAAELNALVEAAFS